MADAKTFDTALIAETKMGFTQIRLVKPEEPMKPNTSNEKRIH